MLFSARRVVYCGGRPIQWIIGPAVLEQLQKIIRERIEFWMNEDVPLPPPRTSEISGCWHAFHFVLHMPPRTVETATMARYD
jgi:hypothetical protein